MKRQWKWRAICDVCGFKYWSDELQKRWDGLMVCKEDYELRHPMDYIKVPKDDQTIPWSRPEQEDVFITITYVASSVGTQGVDVPDGPFTVNNGTL